MFKTLLSAGIASLSLSQAHAMMDPSDNEPSTPPAATRRQETLAPKDEGKGASSATLSQASDHKQNQNPEGQNNETREHHDRNASLARKREFEYRLAALESQLNDAQIGAPRNVRHVTTLPPHQSDDEVFDESLYGENTFMRDEPVEK